jgi:hypothetical protein
MITLDRLEAKLDALLAGKEDTVRFRNLMTERLDTLESKLLAIFTRLCAQQEARRGKRAKSAK